MVVPAPLYTLTCHAHGKPPLHRAKWSSRGLVSTSMLVGQSAFIPKKTSLAPTGWVIIWSGIHGRYDFLSFQALPPCTRRQASTTEGNTHPSTKAQTLHVYHIYIYICLHWGGLGGQCRHVWHTWSVRERFCRNCLRFNVMSRVMICICFIQLPSRRSRNHVLNPRLDACDLRWVVHPGEVLALSDPDVCAARSVASTKQYGSKTPAPPHTKQTRKVKCLKRQPGSPEHASYSFSFFSALPPNLEAGRSLRPRTSRGGSKPDCSTIPVQSTPGFPVLVVTVTGYLPLLVQQSSSSKGSSPGRTRPTLTRRPPPRRPLEGHSPGTTAATPGRWPRGGGVGSTGGGRQQGGKQQSSHELGRKQSSHKLSHSTSWRFSGPA